MLFGKNKNQSENSSAEEISGTVERITFRNDENGWTVARFMRDKGGLATITGRFAAIHQGEHLTLSGQWVRHEKFGQQFEVLNYKVSVPPTLDGMEKYLGSGLIPGIGPFYAKKIMKHFGERIFEILENEPERIREVPGIGETKARKFIEAFESQKSIQNLMIWLQEHEVSPKLAIRIYKHYGDDAIRVLRENPYELADDLFGVGFITADGIARKLGIAENDPKRHRAGIRYVLKEATNDGHVYLPREVLYESAENLLKASYDEIRAAIDFLASDGAVIVDDDRIYLRSLFTYEAEIARILAKLGRGWSRSYDSEKSRELIDKIQRHENISLAEEQAEAVERALKHQCTVITGGPGTGKSTTVKVIVRAFEREAKVVRLASPTGRAAKRLEEATGRPASTIHRLLEFHPNKGFQRNEDQPLDAKVVVIDEASMIDIPLMYFLLRALTPDCRLILVGDVDQLPSVGPGCVLKDVIDSGVIEVVSLVKIFRQAADSLIVTNAHRINQGGMPSFDPGKKDDFKWIGIERNSPNEEPSNISERIADALLEQLRNDLSKKYDPLTKIQVLTPMHAGPVGAKELNRRLQETFNPKTAGKTELRLGDRVFRIGDRVMQTKNNYELEVFNGDIGSIIKIDTKEGIVIIEYDREVVYKRSDLDEVQLAYAITVHKSQGSEYPCVAVPLTTSHWIMLQRNLLYTAVTRAKKFCMLIGQTDALRRAVRNADTSIRHTNLRERMIMESRKL